MKKLVKKEQNIWKKIGLFISLISLIVILVIAIKMVPKEENLFWKIFDLGIMAGILCIGVIITYILVLKKKKKLFYTTSCSGKILISFPKWVNITLKIILGVAFISQAVFTICTQEKPFSSLPILLLTIGFALWFSGFLKELIFHLNNHKFYSYYGKPLLLLDNILFGMISFLLVIASFISIFVQF